MRRKICMSFLTIVTIMLLFTRVNAATISDLQKQKTEAEKNKAEAQSDLQENKAEQATTNDELDQINSNISELSSKISDLEGDISDLNESIDNKQAEIDKKEKEISDKEDLLKKRLVSMYKTGGLSYLDVLLGSDSYFDMLTCYSAVSEIADADTSLINSISEEKTNLEGEKQELENEKSSLVSKKSELNTQNSKLKSAQSEKQQKIASLSESAKDLQAKIDEYTKAINQSEAQIKAQQRAAQAKINKGASTNKSGQTGGHISNTSGTLGWPLPSSYQSERYITSYFGKRRAPTSGASTNHGAIDIGIPTGTGVYAAEAGYIVACGWYGGYGNYIRIWHKAKGELYTCYGHLSAFKVSVGDYVARGDLIALSGSTGVSTGPHLHFEVRSGGSSSGCRVDPLNYLSL